MYNLYILYSPNFDKYYVGISDDPLRRLFEHNNTTRNTFTSKYRPWELFLFFEVSENLSKAMRIEKKVKKQKNRTIYYKLKDPAFRKEFLSSVC